MDKRSNLQVIIPNLSVIIVICSHSQDQMDRSLMKTRANTDGVVSEHCGAPGAARRPERPVSNAGLRTLDRSGVCGPGL